MKRIIVLILLFSIYSSMFSKGIPHTVSSWEAIAEAGIMTEDIAEVIHNDFGAKVKVDPSLLADYYLIGDFNGDGNTDIAVIVKPEEGKTDIGQFNVNFISIDPSSPKNGQRVDPVASMNEHNDACLGVAIIHGTSSGWKTQEPLGKYMFYECFSDFRLIPRGQKVGDINRSGGPIPKAKGDAIKLELESGAETIVYWDGHTYRGYPQTEGD